MRVLIVEDNPQQVEWLQSTLLNKIPGATIDLCCTECEFRTEFETIAANPPEVVLMDVMLKWTDPAPDMILPPQEIATAGYRRAGLRCQKMLENDERTSHVPVILYTALAASSIRDELDKVPSGVKYLPKDSNPEPLIDQIRRAVNRT